MGFLKNPAMFKANCPGSFFSSLILEKLTYLLSISKPSFVCFLNQTSYTSSFEDRTIREDIYCVQYTN